jgi:hypothetical protein
MNNAFVAGIAVVLLSLTGVATQASARDADASVAQLAARLKVLEDKYEKLQDVQDLEKLQRIYGYYIERGQLDEVADLFSTRPDVSLEMSGGLQVGIKNVRKMFSSATPFGVMKPGTKPEDYLHVTAPISGVVDVDPDGKTAKGRWYALMFLNDAGMGGGAVWGVGIYENDYVKEGGKWKILHLRFDDIFLSTYDKKGWINTMPFFTGKMTMPPGQQSAGMPPPGRGRSSKTPFAELMPYHYKNPVTGR